LLIFVTFPNLVATWEESHMRRLAILAVCLAVAFVFPAFAAEPQTKEECEKIGGTWDDAAKKCS
jgi:hypothetical protein